MKNLALRADVATELYGNSGTASQQTGILGQDTARRMRCAASRPAPAEPRAAWPAFRRGCPDPAVGPDTPPGTPGRGDEIGEKMNETCDRYGRAVRAARRTLSVQVLREPAFAGAACPGLEYRSRLRNSPARVEDCILVGD
jgi:hypothetical protein